MQTPLPDFIDQHFPDISTDLRAEIEKDLEWWLDDQLSNRPFYERHIYKSKDMEAHINRGVDLLDELVEWFEYFPDGMRHGLNNLGALNSDRGRDEMLVGVVTQARRLRDSMRGETSENPSDNLFEWLRQQNLPFGKTMTQSGEKARHWQAVRVLNYLWEKAHGPLPQRDVNRFTTAKSCKSHYVVYLECGLELAGIHNHVADVLANHRKVAIEG
jgi:hypothetical protein